MRQRHPRPTEEQHRGGTWKIAYADFITTMMGFFLLLWLLDITTEEQRKGLSEYFLGASNFLDPPKIIEKQDIATPSLPLKEDSLSEGVSPGDKESVAQSQWQILEMERKVLNTVKGSPEFQKLAKHFVTEKTKKGLKIQIIDPENKPLFDRGSPHLSPYAKKLVGVVAKIIKNVPNSIVVTGHTDATPLERTPKYTNWELSIDRANNVRKELLENGIPPSRFSAVIGRESVDPIAPHDPTSCQNRRFSIMLE